MSVIVRALARWSWILVLSLIIGYVLGKVLTSLLPPNYQATSIVQLNGQSHGGTIVQTVDTYGNLITSDAILGTALKDFPNLNRDAVGTKQLVVSPDDKSQSISIQVTLPNAKESADLAN